MKPIAQFPDRIRQTVRFVLTDIDDTLTVAGRLPAVSLAAMERLRAAGTRVVAVTGRPAGWCDHIARMWPVDGLVGENGAFYFRYDDRNRKMVRRWWKPAAERAADRRRLAAVEKRVLAEVPGCRTASDQPWRAADLAIDFCEDVAPLPPEAVARIAAVFRAAGAEARVSSIHVNGWFGDYDKLNMSRRLLEEQFGTGWTAAREATVYVGDSPNDAPMFAAFPLSVGVANVRRFAGRMEHLPAWVTAAEGGWGFAEMVDVLLGLDGRADGGIAREEGA